MSKPKYFNEVQFVLISRYSPDISLDVSALVTDTITTPIKSIQSTELEQLMASQKLPLSLEFNEEYKEIDVLIGADLYHNFHSGKRIETKFGPTALDTLMGYTLSGPVKLNSDDIIHNMVSNVKLLSCVQKFWELDSLGIVDIETTVHNNFLKTST